MLVKTISTMERKLVKFQKKVYSLRRITFWTKSLHYRTTINLEEILRKKLFKNKFRKNYGGKSDNQEKTWSTTFWFGGVQLCLCSFCFFLCNPLPSIYFSLPCSFVPKTTLLLSSFSLPKQISVSRSSNSSRWRAQCENSKNTLSSSTIRLFSPKNIQNLIMSWDNRFCVINE